MGYKIIGMRCTLSNRLKGDRRNCMNVKFTMKFIFHVLSKTSSKCQPFIFQELMSESLKETISFGVKFGINNRI